MLQANSRVTHEYLTETQDKIYLFFCHKRPAAYMITWPAYVLQRLWLQKSLITSVCQQHLQQNLDLQYHLQGVACQVHRHACQQRSKRLTAQRQRMLAGAALQLRLHVKEPSSMASYWRPASAVCQL